MAATDGHRLALCRYAANEDETAFNYIIPRKTVGVISQYLANADVEIFSVSNGNKIIDTVLEFKGPGLVLRSKLIDGTFPDIERVIPNDTPTTSRYAQRKCSRQYVRQPRLEAGVVLRYVCTAYPEGSISKSKT